MDINNPSNPKQEFQDFLSAAPSAPSAELSAAIFAHVERDLCPSAWSVFAKLAVIHFMTSVATLSVCPQFGYRVRGEGMGIQHYFMGLGEYGCMVACGFLFLGTSLLAATLFLRREEIRAIRKNRLSELSALAFLSLGFFIMVDAEVVLSLAIAWFLGSLAGGLALLELGSLFRLSQNTGALRRAS